MQPLKLLTLTLVVVLLIGALPVMASAGAPAPNGMTPMLKIGPKAIPAAAAGPNYGLFTCQLGLTPYQCYDPYQMRTAYGVDKAIAAGFDGTGKTIVIVDAFQDPNIVSQLNYFDSFYGLPNANFTQIAPDGLTPFDPNDPNMTGWAEEITLDVLWAHAIAPGANITLVLAKTNNDPDILSALKYAVDNNLGDVVSMSFGEAESCLGADLTAGYHQVFVQGTIKGMSFFASSGDEGAAQPSCDGSSWVKEASAPASDPLVTGVGGTELHAANYCSASLGCDPATHPAPGTYQGEIAWNEGYPFGDFQDFIPFTIATGGGFSAIWNKPAYQVGTVPDGNQRGVPDVAYNAAVYHGVLTYLDIPGDFTGWTLFGGTSAGAPQWAAITAIADQIAGRDLGFMKAALYRLARSNKSAIFHDITSGTNSAFEYDANGDPVTIIGYNAGPGWDATTGLGSPNVNTAAAIAPAILSGDAASAMATKSHATGKPTTPTRMRPQ